ncbi:transposase [Bradyrhizobium oligotrophicum]|uniref:transposase n=1 Tax=Bradyrhizobium oligotrophicum TaxID=44255 RepID=UPI000A0307F3
MEQFDDNLLYRWFAGSAPDDSVWDPTTFTKNHTQLENGKVRQVSSEAAEPARSQAAAVAKVLSDIKLAQTCFGEPAIRLILPERCSPAGRPDYLDPNFHRGALHLPKIVIAPRISLGGLQAVWNKTLRLRLRSHVRDLRARTPSRRIEHSNTASCGRNGYEETVDQTSKHRSSDCL